MSKRNLFPDLKLFKKTVMESFLVASREIYKNHPAYSYNEKQNETKIHIEPTYGRLEYEGKNPQLIAKVGQYEFSLQDTIGGNLSSDFRNQEGVISGFSSQKNMSTTISITVRAYVEEESSDLADELAMLATYAAHHMFAQVGLNVKGSAVSETRETDNAKDVFDTVVNLVVDIPWELSMNSGKPPVDPGIDLDIEDEVTSGYRPPGAYVFKYLNPEDE